VSQDAVRAALGDSDAHDFTQTAWGADFEYSRDHYLFRVETVLSRWTLPVLRTPDATLPLRAAATSLEGRYKIRPGLYAAARFDHLGFSEISGRRGPESWDAPVSRLELGAGYSLQRNLLLKVAYQHNTRDGGRVRFNDLVAAQVAYWF
jgi:predicted porin